jgi:hypothetical protein
MCVPGVGRAVVIPALRTRMMVCRVVLYFIQSLDSPAYVHGIESIQLRQNEYVTLFESVEQLIEARALRSRHRPTDGFLDDAALIEGEPAPSISRR